ncbi:hypothetical protein TNCT_639281 [Trichonephila clavata]|uniref:Uncharacterized protein n=1 Tax=Trichonephila clavata TaxID=2740835 RepID=A0A8X6LZ05_TRICU|nr:hypothetical protein TNCT_639281 [Trichonephila clavata]
MREMNSHQKTTKFTCRNPTSSFSNEGIISNLTLKDLLLSILPLPIQECFQIGEASSYTYLLALSGGPRWSEEGSYRDLESPRFMTKRHQLWMVPSPPTRILSVEEGGNRPLHHPSSIDPQGEEEVTVCCPPNPSSLGGQPVPGYCAKVIRLCRGWWKYFINRLFLSFSQRVVPNCFLGSDLLLCEYFKSKVLMKSISDVVILPPHVDGGFVDNIAMLVLPEL